MEYVSIAVRNIVLFNMSAISGDGTLSFLNDTIRNSLSELWVRTCVSALSLSCSPGGDEPIQLASSLQ